MEFYLSQSYTYQAGPNDYRYVDLGRLPPSEQQRALAAIQNPGGAGNLVFLSGLQAKYPTAFANVPGLSTLPAPDLTVPMGGSFPLQAGIDMLLAYLIQKNFETSNKLAEEGGQRVVNSSRMSMDLADKAKTKAEDAARNTMIAGLVGGGVAIGSGLGSLGASIHSGRSSSAHGKAMKESTRSQLETQDYKDTMERSVKQLQDTANNNRAQAQQLKGYADEVDSPDGLSPASRQKIDDEIKAKNDQLKDILDQRDIAQRDAERRSKDLTLTASERAQAKTEFDGFVSGKGPAAKEFDAQAERLTNSRRSLIELKAMNDDKIKLGRDMKRLDELMGKDAPTPAEAREMLALQKDKIPQRVQSLVEHRAKVQKQIDGLNSEATRLDAGADGLKKSAQDELASRKVVHDEQNTDLNREMTDTELKARGFTTGFTALSQSTNLFSAGPQMVAQIDTAEKEHMQAQGQFVDTSKGLADRFSSDMAEKAKDATQFWQQYNQNSNDVVTSIAHNI